MDEIISAILRHMGEVLFALIFLASAIAPAFKKKKRQQQGPLPGTGSDPADAAPTTPTDLEERVRRNFEELMRKRRGESAGPAAAPDMPPAAPAPPAPAPPPPAPAPPPPAPRPRPARPRRTAPAPTASRPAPRPAPRPTTRRSPPPPPSRPQAPADAWAIEPKERTWGGDHVLETEQEAAQAYSRGPGRRERRGGNHLLKDYQLRGDNLRRAILLKEILDRPVSERPDSEQAYWE